MATTADRKSHFVDMVCNADVLSQCPTFAMLSADWMEAVEMWRAKRRLELSNAQQAAQEAKQLDESRRSFRERRNSEFLMADSLLKEAHKELDDLLSQSSQVTAQSKTKASFSTPSTSSSYISTFLTSTQAPTNVADFDGRIPEVVPTPYFNNAVCILQRLDPKREVVTNSSRSAAGVASSGQQRSSSCLALVDDSKLRRGCEEKPESMSRIPTHPISLVSVARDTILETIHDLSELMDAVPVTARNAVLYNCRAACHYAVGNTRLSLRDSLQASDIGGSHLTTSNSDRLVALRRALRCYLMMFDSKGAQDVVARLNALRGDNCGHDEDQSLFHEYGRYVECMQNKIYSQALSHVTALFATLAEAPFAEKIAELLVLLESPTALAEVSSSCVRFPSWAGLWYWYGLLQMRHSEQFEHLEQAQRSLERATSLSGVEGHPLAKQELQKLKYIESKAAMAMSYHRSKRWRQSIQELTILVTLQGLSKGLKLHFMSMRARSFFASGRPVECISDTTYMLNHSKSSSDLVIAYILRSEAHLLAKDFEAAAIDARCAVGVVPSNGEAQEQLRRVEAASASSSAKAAPPSPPPTPPPPSSGRGGGGAQRPHSSATGRGTHDRFDDSEDRLPTPPPKPNSQATASARRPLPPHYLVLGIHLQATSTAVTKAYHAAALKWHPDRWIMATAQEKQQAEELFKKLNTAYEVLSDGAARQAYDIEHGVASR